MKSILSLAAVALTACSATSAGDSAISSDEAPLRATTPAPYVLQYAGRYERATDGDVDAIVLNRDGTFTSTVDGLPKHGVFVGPAHPKQPLVVSVVMRGDFLSATVRENWEAMRYEIDVDHHATKTTLHATFPAGGEDVCDRSGGQWTDDDPDPKTGLYCVCPAAQAFIPSLGGCVP